LPATPSSAGAAPAASRRGLVRFFAANVLFGAGLFAHAFLYNFYLQELGAAEGVMGYAAAAITAGGLAALLPAGALVDRLGPRHAYVAAAAVAAAGLLAGALATDIRGLYLAAFVAGAGAGAWRVAMGPIVMGLAEGEARSRAFSWNVALLVGSGAVWTYLSGVLPGLFGGGLAGVRVALALAAGLTLLSAPVLWPIALRPAPRPAPGEGTPGAGHAAGPLRRALAALAVPRFVAVLVALVALWMVASGLVIPFFNLFFQRAHSLPVARIGLVMGAAQVLTALVVFASGEAAARLGPRRMLALWCVVFAPALWGLAAGGALSVALALFLVQGLVAPATNPLIDQLLLERAPPGRQGVVAGWRGAATEGSGLVAAAAGGRLLEAGSFQLLFLVAGTVGAVAAAGLLLALRATRAAARRPGAPGELPAASAA